MPTRPRYTRRFYVQMAASIARMNLSATGDEIFTQEGVKQFAETWCETFSRDNPRFDRMRFLTACGLKP